MLALPRPTSVTSVTFTTEPPPTATNDHSLMVPLILEAAHSWIRDKADQDRSRSLLAQQQGRKAGRGSNPVIYFLHFSAALDSLHSGSIGSETRDIPEKGRFARIRRRYFVSTDAWLVIANNRSREGKTRRIKAP